MTQNSSSLTAPIQTAGIKYIIDGKYPTWMKNHHVFSKINKITKVFPSIGLPNLEEPTEYSATEARLEASSLTSYIAAELSSLLSCAPGSPIRQVLNDLISQLYNSASMIVEGEDGKCSIKCSKDILFEAKPFIKGGESLFKAYNKISEKCKELGLSKTPLPLESITSFKNFSSLNIGKKDYKLVFSSDGEKGAWDIATISMRGITSCQAWDTAQSRGLIGSITSKFVGVIYITNGVSLNEYGTRMLRRSIVRFAVNKNTKKPALLVERSYPLGELTTIKTFKDFLKKRSNLPVLYGGESGWTDYYIPDDPYWKIAPLQNGELSYMDTKIYWKNEIPQTKIDISQCRNRIASLNNIVMNNIHNTVLKMLNEYATDKETHKDIFKGGVANLILHLKKYFGGTYASTFVPVIYNFCIKNQYKGMLPQPENFQLPELYEKEFVRSLVLSSKFLHKQANVLSNKGSWSNSFPKSAKKLTDLTVRLLKQELISHYKNLAKNK